MKSEEQIKKFRGDVLEQLTTAAPENVKFLQGVIYGLDWPALQEQKDE